MLSLSDPLSKRPTGRLHLDIFEYGRLIDVFDECNLVVDGYKNIHAHLVGGDTANYRVTQFGVGTGGVAPSPGNIVLSSPFLKAVDSVSYPSFGVVQYGFSLGSAEANGMDIMEFGLLAAGGALYARRVRASALTKNAGISFSGTWTITF